MKNDNYIYPAVLPYETTDALPDEVEALNKWRNGDPEYQPAISHEDLKKELGLV